MSLLEFILIAFTVPASTYGYGEYMCGEVEAPKACEYGAITASGQIFDPELATAAVFAPFSLRMYPVIVTMQVEGGPCVEITVNDKGNPRYIGERGFDLTPGALQKLGVRPHPQWSGMLYPCEKE